MGWLVWDKGQRDFSLADGELAWTSFDRALRIKTHARAKAMKDGKRHPTQKSLTIMKWCLLNSTKEGEIVCDPFMGSGTTGLACKELGRDFIGIEIHQPYFEISERRINQATKELFT